MHIEPQLKSKIWADALIRRARSGDAFAYLRKHGDDDAGIVVIKVAYLNGKAMIWAPERDENYRRVWVAQLHIGESEEDADNWIEKALQRDPDLWVIEIEDRLGRHFLLPGEFSSLDGP